VEELITLHEVFEIFQCRKNDCVEHRVEVECIQNTIIKNIEFLAEMVLLATILQRHFSRRTAYQVQRMGCGRVDAALG